MCHVRGHHGWILESKNEAAWRGLQNPGNLLSILCLNSVWLRLTYWVRVIDTGVDGVRAHTGASTVVVRVCVSAAALVGDAG